MSETQHSGQMPTRVVLLLALCVFINYVDRGNLATASPLLKDELHLSNSKIGVLLSAFFWSYAPAQLIAGWLAQRFDIRSVLACGLVIWSTATALTGLAGGFAALLGLRVLLGLGESVAYPCNAKLLSQRAPEHQRGFANGLIATGQALGPTFGTLVGGLLMARLGWRVVFIGLGLASVLWLWPWLRATRTDATRIAGVFSRKPPSYRSLLQQRALWGASAGSFCCAYAFYFVLTWLPLYLVKARGLSLSQMAWIGALIYCVQALTSVVGGWASDRWIVVGASPTLVRKTFMVTGLLGVAICMLLCSIAGPVASILLLALAAVFFGAHHPGMWAIAQTLAGPRAAARWVGIQNFVGNLAGIVAPIVTGLVVDRTGQFLLPFLIAATIALIGSLAWGAVVPRVEPVSWNIEVGGLEQPALSTLGSTFSAQSPISITGFSGSSQAKLDCGTRS